MEVLNPICKAEGHVLIVQVADAVLTDDLYCTRCRALLKGIAKWNFMKDRPCNELGHRMGPMWFKPKEGASKAQALRKCVVCEVSMDATDEAKESMPKHRCGGFVVTFLDPNTFALARKCLDCDEVAA